MVHWTGFVSNSSASLDFISHLKLLWFAWTGAACVCRASAGAGGTLVSRRRASGRAPAMQRGSFTSWSHINQHQNTHTHTTHNQHTQHTHTHTQHTHTHTTHTHTTHTHTQPTHNQHTTNTHTHTHNQHTHTHTQPTHTHTQPTHTQPTHTHTHKRSLHLTRVLIAASVSCRYVGRP